MESEFTQEELNNIKARVAANINYLERVVYRYFNESAPNPTFNSEYNNTPVSQIRESLLQLIFMMKPYSNEFSNQQLDYINYLCLQIETIESFNEELVFLNEKILNHKVVRIEILKVYSIIYALYRNHHIDLTRKLISKLNLILRRYNKDEYIIPEEDELWSVFLFKYDLIQKFNSGFYSTSRITLNELIDMYTYSENLPYYTTLPQLYSIKRLVRVIIRRRLDYLDQIIEKTRNDQLMNLEDAINEKNYLSDLFKKLIISVTELDEIYEINKTRGQLETSMIYIKNYSFDGTISEINLRLLRTIRNSVDKLESLGDEEWLEDVKADLLTILKKIYKFYSTREIQNRKTLKKMAILEEIISFL